MTPKPSLLQDPNHDWWKIPTTRVSPKGPPWTSALSLASKWRSQLGPCLMSIDSMPGPSGRKNALNSVWPLAGCIFSVDPPNRGVFSVVFPVNPFSCIVGRGLGQPFKKPKGT